jgi:hypothetical protein
MNNELKDMEEAVVPNFRYHIAICLQVLKKSTQKSTQESRSPDLNPEPS